MTCTEIAGDFCLGHSKGTEVLQPAPTPKMVFAKVSLSTELLYFVKGDDVGSRVGTSFPRAGCPLR